MQPVARPTNVADLLSLRTRHRAEMHCQIVHDSIPGREGWVAAYLLELDGLAVGYGLVAIGGPWTGKPTIIEFYLLPESRCRAFELFEVFLEASGSRLFEAQTSHALLTMMVHTFGREIESEKVVFEDRITTSHTSNGATLRSITSDDEIRTSRQRRQGGGEWVLELEGTLVGKGGILFHYNWPYADLYMEVAEPFRRRGFGVYLVQELKRISYALGAVPCARCNPANIASRQTLQKAGFVPTAHILIGSLSARPTRN